MLTKFEELGRQLVRSPNCEFCNKKLHGLVNDTVCKECDDEMARQEEIEAAQQAKAWGLRYRCKLCSASLPVGRLAYCKLCFTQPLEDQFDNVKSIKRESIRLLASHKVCKTCKENKLATEYKIVYPRGYLYYQCKDCESTYRKKQRIRLKEAKNEQGN